MNAIKADLVANKRKVSIRQPFVQPLNEMLNIIALVMSVTSM